MTSLRFMLGVVAADNLELIQLDVKTAFLHSDLQEEIYMKSIRPETGTPTVVQEVRRFHLVGRLLKER